MVDGAAIMAWAFAGSILALFLFGLGAILLWRPLFATLLRRVIHRILTDPYEENLWELVNTLRRVGAQVMVETSLRAHTGQPLLRPFGTVRRFPGLGDFTFNFAQLARKPLDEDPPPDVSVVIGPRARRPLRLDLPVLVGGMAYGLSLSERAVVALALGTAGAGTSVNTGEGPYLPSQRNAARYLILQWNRGDWAKDDATLQAADAVEIQIGQGARGALSRAEEGRSLDDTVRRAIGVRPEGRAVVSATLPEIESLQGLPRLLERIRQSTGGVPVGVKLAAGQDLERDLAQAVLAGVDFITLCGAEGGTWGSPPTLEDDFGLPTTYALIRAARFFRARGLRGKVSLIADGGLFTPGDFLKAIALGADAVSIGTVALFALAHVQVLRSVPWEPPTQLVYYGAKQAEKLDVAAAAKSLTNFLLSCRSEMQQSLGVMGRASLAEVSSQDLIALDPRAARYAGVAFGGATPAPKRVKVRRQGGEAAKPVDQATEGGDAPRVVKPAPLQEWLHAREDGLDSQ